MIHKVWVQNPSGSVLELDLRRSADEVGIVVFRIDGLGPPDAIINSSGGPGYDGAQVNSVKTDVRRMSMTLAIQKGSISEEDAKQAIYTFFPIKQTITVGFVTDRKNVTIQARVERNKANEFSTVENFEIELVSPQPYFVDVKEGGVVISPDGAVPLFEFPWSNESLVSDLLVFGEIYALPTYDISYPGEVKTGVDIVMSFSGNVEDVTITNANGNQVMSLDFADAEAFFGSAVANGDQVIINTKFGEKSIYFVRSGTFFNMINGVDIDSDWIELHPGGNLVQINASTGASNIETDVSWHALREGI